ncbi:MAG: WG repeat-containing protein [Clostridiales bacterium]|nr:WG repeat-containing protein [Clostridiales bacterium]
MKWIAIAVVASLMLGIASCTDSQVSADKAATAGGAGSVAGAASSGRTAEAAPANAAALPGERKPDQEAEAGKGRVPVASGGVLLPAGGAPEDRYHPQVPPERYYDETVLGLRPASGYGRILPFIGGFTVGDQWFRNTIFGLCDDKGRVVCDPYYDAVEVIARGDAKLYALRKNLFVTTRTEHTWGPYDEPFIESYETTLCPDDGAWAEVYGNVVYREKYASEAFASDKFPDWYLVYDWRASVEYEYITASREGKWGVLDWDGAVLLPFAYWEPVCFREGLACVLSEDGATVSYINIHGEAVLGPYEAPPAQEVWFRDYTSVPRVTQNLLFHEGFSRFYADGKYGMIDMSGKVAVPAVYEFITSFADGMAITLSDGGVNQPQHGLVNTAGVVIAEGLGGFTPFFWEGKALVECDWSARKGASITSDGLREAYSAPANEWVYARDGKIVFADGRELEIHDATGFDKLANGLIAAYFGERSSEDCTWRLYDVQGNALTQEQPGAYLWTWEAMDSGQYLWAYTSLSESRKILLYSMDGEPILRKGYEEVIPMDGYFMATDNRFARLIDGEENDILIVSLLPFFSD